ncbi:hypothetical protein MMC28_009075 [Mycoblastus sanguinarius]|nr:hypothetical protein [Mycoblastus sanguinarius]
MALAARDSSATVSALASLRPRLDRLSIVATKPIVSYPGTQIFQPQNYNTLPVEFQNFILNRTWYPLCSSIAPWEEWHQQKKIRYWPGLSADAEVVEEDAFNASMQKVPDTLYETRNLPGFRRRNATFEPRRIRAWHWRRPDAVRALRKYLG